MMLLRELIEIAVRGEILAKSLSMRIKIPVGVI
jgi:hypothetical protein